MESKAYSVSWGSYQFATGPLQMELVIELSVKSRYWCVSEGTRQSSFMLNASIPEVCCLRPSWTIDVSFQLRHQPRCWLCRHDYVLEGL